MKYGIVKLAESFGVENAKFSKLSFIEEPAMDLEHMQGIVGGLIERVSIDKAEENDIDIWVNEEGKILNLEPTAIVRETNSGRILDALAGTILITATDGNGGTIPLNDEQINIVKEIFSSRDMSCVTLTENNSPAFLFNLNI